MEQLVLLAIIGLISLVNWVLQKAAEKREQAQSRRVERREVKQETRRNVYTQPTPAVSERRRPAGAERDPFKDLMEALGLPSEDELPAPVTASSRPVEENEFSSWEDVAPPPLPKPVWQAPPRPKKPDRKTAQLASAFAAVEEQMDNFYGSQMRDLLGSREAQRQAIILAEILGTPRGLTPAGHVPAH